MLLIQIFIQTVLLVIFWQDLKSRAVHWILFLMLVVLFIVLRKFCGQDIIEMLPNVIKNLVFLLLLFAILCAYFSIKQGHWVNITVDMIGWGDVLFFIAVAFYLSTLTFLLFYVAGLIISLLAWLSWKVIFGHGEDKHIPLAGLLAGGLSIMLGICWWGYKINLTNDEWVMSLLIK